MQIIYRAMTMQTCNYHPKPELVYGTPEFQFEKPNGHFGRKREGIEQQVIVSLISFQKCVCTFTNAFYEKNEVYFSKSSRLIDRETLEISINGSDFEKVNFEKCLNEKYIAIEGSENSI